MSVEYANVALAGTWGQSTLTNLGQVFKHSPDPLEQGE